MDSGGYKYKLPLSSQSCGLIASILVESPSGLYFLAGASLPNTWGIKSRPPISSTAGYGISPQSLLGKTHDVCVGIYSTKVLVHIVEGVH